MAQGAAPAKEMDALKRMVGTWQIDGSNEPTPWGKGGRFTQNETCELFSGGHHVVCSASGSGPDGAMHTKSVYYWDAAKQQYTSFIIDNTGYTASTPFKATPDGFAWESESPSPSGPVRFRGDAAFSADGRSYAYKTEVMKDGKWAKSGEGKATRRH
jgi:hypothetical protein